MTSSKLLANQKGSQFADNIPDCPTEELHEHSQWRPFGDLGFVDAYCKIKAHFVLRFRCGDSQEFVASFQRDWREDVFGNKIWASLARRQEKSFWEATCSRKFLSWSEGAHRIYKAHGQEQAMLVDIVELVKLPQEGIASLIWLDTVENFESILPYGWYNSMQHGFVTMGRVSDWEFRVGSDDWDKSASEVIESSAKAVNDIAKDQWNLSGNGWKIGNMIAEISRLRVCLSERRDGVIVMEAAKSGFQFVDVLFGPIESV